MSAEIKTKKEATKRSWIGINVAIVGIILAFAGLVVGIIGIKGCSDSSQRPAQPEAERRSVANNPTETCFKNVREQLEVHANVQKLKNEKCMKTFDAIWRGRIEGHS